MNAPFIPPRWAWTVERVTKLTELWAAGHTALAICVAIGAPSRNAVCGKLGRLKFPPRDDSKPRRPSVWTKDKEAELSQLLDGRSYRAIGHKLGVSRSAVEKKVHRLKRRAARPARTVSPSPPLPKPRPEPKPILEPPQSLGVALADLEPCHCRWIAGDTRPKVLFCGAAKIVGSSYCAWHKKLSIAQNYTREERAAYNKARIARFSPAPVDAGGAG